MRSPLHVFTVLLGLALVALAAVKSLGAPLATLALFAAAAIVTELAASSDDDVALDPDAAEPFRLSAAVHVAAILVLGGWPAAVVAACGALAVGPLRGRGRERIAGQATAFAVATIAGGFAFRLAGGHAGSLSLPRDLIPVVAVAATYVAVRTVALELTGAGEAIELDPTGVAAEAGLGVAFALLVLARPWDALALVPVGIAVYHAHARFMHLRRENARALETFANIVDERDPYTYRHSQRVAEYVEILARGLRLPPGDVARLRWAGRLHDLGKVAVDAVVLRKPGGLDGGEWAAMRRHPRLSARLLQRFRFAAQQARAVEYHHERYDGTGYYGVAGADLPLASHFLILADSFDAMTTDRPYRRGLSHAEALEEIERASGTQFHPVLAKAFVAVQRGVDPLAELSAEELASLRGQVSSPAAAAAAATPRRLRERPERLAVGGVLLALVGIGMRIPALVVAGGAVAAVGVALRAVVVMRAGRLTTSLREIKTGGGRDAIFAQAMDRIGRAWDVSWSALVSWPEHGLGGAVEIERGRTHGPSEPALMSWLLREAESDSEFIVASGYELGDDTPVHVALPLRRDNSALVGFIVASSPRAVPRHVELALRSSLDELGLALAERPQEASEPTVSAIPVASAV